MLVDADVIATIAVKNLETAKKFYEGTLGLKPVGNNQMGVSTYRSGNSKVLVYQSSFAGTNKATAATWAVDDVEGEVAALRSKGVKFEHYDLPMLTLKGDVHVKGDFMAAWFKDPDGNILQIVSR